MVSCSHVYSLSDLVVDICIVAVWLPAVRRSSERSVHAASESLTAWLRYLDRSSLTLSAARTGDGLGRRTLVPTRTPVRITGKLSEFAPRMSHVIDGRMWTVTLLK